jgi:integrase
MADLRRELDAGQQPASTRSLADYLTGWLDVERARVRPSTWRFRAGHIKLYILPALGTVQLAALVPRDIERLTAGMVERGLAPRTALGCRTTLRKALADAQRDGLVNRNVAALARPPRVPGREVEYLDRAELRTLLDSLGDDPMGPLVTLAATTGLRQGELLGLAWSDVDLAHGTLTVRHSMARDWSGGFSLSEPKTARSRRVVHLPDLAVAALERQRDRQDRDRRAAGADVWQNKDGLVFTDTVGRPTTGTEVSHGFRTLVKRAGVKHVPFHALRHSWATLALASGVPLKVIADNLGHASIVVTAAFYSGIVPELNRDAADAVGRALT